MGAAFEVVTGFNSPATTTAGTYVAFTANSGQSFSIRQANGSPSGQVFGPWGQFGAAGKLQVKTPRWHDTTVGDTYHINIGTATYMPYPMLRLDDWEPAYATDNLTVQMTTDVSQTAATAYGIGIPIYYSDLPGVDGNFMSWQQVIGFRNYTQKTGLHYTSWVVPSQCRDGRSDRHRGAYQRHQRPVQGQPLATLSWATRARRPAPPSSSRAPIRATSTWAARVHLTSGSPAVGLSTCRPRRACL